MKQHQELGHDALHVVCHKYLVTEQLDAVALEVEVRLNLGEVENTREVEGIVDVEVNPEQGLVGYGVELAVELLVVLVLQVGRLLRPQGLSVVNHVVLLRLLLLAVLPFSLLAEDDGDGQETAVLLQQCLQFVFLE